MRTIHVILAGLICIGARAAAPEYPVHRPACPVTLDGDIEGDPAWAAIPAMIGFSVLGGSYTHTKQTVAQMCADDEALYLAVTCEEPDAVALNPQVRDGGDTWGEDSLEIFLQPLPNAQVYQIGITAGGARGGFVGDPDPMGFQAATRIGSDRYTVEARFPYTLVKGVPEGTWRGNVCRNIFVDKSPGDKFTSWAPLERQFLEPDNFAYLTFELTTLTPEDADHITARINAAYRETLLRLVAEAAAMGAQYVDTLKEASADPAFGECARRLSRQWRAIDRMNRRAQTASITDMRQALAKLRALNDESYETKYKYLISKLISEAMAP
ncbi:MAG: carbohydrate-binding family 9-like protein [Armatimonadetes bacterium]|nr:carbohydrate-binding family 9-like protein [Armatimonadota bacterium]MDI9584568.1 carbohydrate-binding family 9-like protein [Acidobacteriota bacterium]